MRPFAISILVAFGLFFVGCEEEPKDRGAGPTLDTREAPETPEELVERMVVALANAGDVLHVELGAVVPDGDGGEVLFGNYEGWFDFDDLRGRVSYEKGPDNDTDTPEWLEHWIDGEKLYRQGPDDREPREAELGSHWRTCVGLEPLVADVLICGMASQAGNYELAEPAEIVEGKWHGINAVGIQYVWELTVAPQNPLGRPPTPTPEAGTPAADPDEPFVWRSETVFFVDTGTYLPLGLRSTSYRDSVEVNSGDIAYEVEFIDVDDFDHDILDPLAAGFRTDEEAEMELLDSPHGDAPVYWLGREFDAGGEVGTVRLAAAESWYHPERPTRITLRYEGEDGERFALDIWDEAEWEEFKGRLQEADNNSGRWPFGDACRDMEAFSTGNFEGNVIAGFYSEMRPDGGVVVTTPGVEPPEATPFAAQPCPDRDHDEYMAEVFIDGWAVTFNASIGIFSDGEPDRWDSPETLKALAAGLRLREQGE